MAERNSHEGPHTCPLCGRARAVPVSGPGERAYRRCVYCRLIFVTPRFLPSREAAMARYRLHENGPGHPGYARFLGQALLPALPHIAPGARGLDYGCGPSPVLGGLLSENNRHCENYDPLFHPPPPSGLFDFVFATECFEHFFRPGREMARISRLLAPGGLLTVMTEPWTTETAFARWHYARDFTHVCFFHADTFAFIGRKFRFSRLESGNQRVFILKKTPPLPAPGPGAGKSSP